MNALHNKETHLGTVADFVERDKALGVEARHHDKGQRPDNNTGE